MRRWYPRINRTPPRPARVERGRNVGVERRNGTSRSSVPRLKKLKLQSQPLHPSQPSQPSMPHDAASVAFE